MWVHANKLFPPRHWAGSRLPQAQGPLMWLRGKVLGTDLLFLICRWMRRVGREEENPLPSGGLSKAQVAGPSPGDTVSLGKKRLAGSP